MEETYIQGVFNGENMVGDDHKIYPVNPNYASKSKLSEGDGLKLIIGDDGSFMYRQVSKLDTIRVRGTVRNVYNQCRAILADGREFRILKATATYFKLQNDDEVVLMVPRDREVTWAAVENVIKIVKDDEKELEIT